MPYKTVLHSLLQETRNIFTNWVTDHYKPDTFSNFIPMTWMQAFIIISYPITEHTYTRLTAFFWDYLGKPVPER